MYYTWEDSPSLGHTKHTTILFLHTFCRPKSSFNNKGNDNGYSDILDIVIFLLDDFSPVYSIPHTKFIEYSDILVIVIFWSKYLCP